MYFIVRLWHMVYYVCHTALNLWLFFFLHKLSYCDHSTDQQTVKQKDEKNALMSHTSKRDSAGSRFIASFM